MSDTLAITEEELDKIQAYLNDEPEMSYEEVEIVIERDVHPVLRKLLKMFGKE